MVPDEKTRVRPLFSFKDKETWLNWGFILRAPPEEIKRMKEHMNKLDFRSLYVYDITSGRQLYVVEETFLEPNQIDKLRKYGIKARKG
jgi:nitrate reductase NapAB chaperone NapD